MLPQGVGALWQSWPNAAHVRLPANRRGMLACPATSHPQGLASNRRRRALRLPPAGPGACCAARHGGDCRGRGGGGVPGGCSHSGASPGGHHARRRGALCKPAQCSGGAAGGLAAAAGRHPSLAARPAAEGRCSSRLQPCRRSIQLQRRRRRRWRQRPAPGSWPVAHLCAPPAAVHPPAAALCQSGGGWPLGGGELQHRMLGGQINAGPENARCPTPLCHSCHISFRSTHTWHACWHLSTTHEN
jgi:hypothetical protein